MCVEVPLDTVEGPLDTVEGPSDIVEGARGLELVVVVDPPWTPVKMELVGNVTVWTIPCPDSGLEVFLEARVPPMAPPTAATMTMMVTTSIMVLHFF